MFCFWTNPPTIWIRSRVCSCGIGFGSLNQQGLTILLTTHDMDEADKLCERIAIMDHGKILVNDTAGGIEENDSRRQRAGDPRHDSAIPATPAQERLLGLASALPGVSKVEQVERTRGCEPPDRLPALGQIRSSRRGRLRKNRRGTYRLTRKRRIAGRLGGASRASRREPKSATCI